MQEAIPLCFDQNTSELQKRPLCIHLQNVLYNIFLIRMLSLNAKVLAWKCLEYIILNNPWPRDRERTFIPANQMNARASSLDQLFEFDMLNMVINEPVPTRSFEGRN